MRMDYATLIKRARKQAGLSQSQAAALWKVSVRSLQKWEINEATPSGENVAKLLPFILPRAAARGAARKPRGVAAAKRRRSTPSPKS